MPTELTLLAARPDAVSLWLDAHPTALGLIFIGMGATSAAVGFTRYRALGLPDAPEGTRPTTSYFRVAMGVVFIGLGIYWIAVNWS